MNDAIVIHTNKFVSGVDSVGNVFNINLSGCYNSINDLFKLINSIPDSLRLIFHWNAAGFNVFKVENTCSSDVGKGFIIEIDAFDVVHSQLRAEIFKPISNNRELHSTAFEISKIIGIGTHNNSMLIIS